MHFRAIAVRAVLPPGSFRGGRAAREDAVNWRFFGDKRANDEPDRA